MRYVQCCTSVVVLLALAQSAIAADAPRDIRRAVPQDVFLVVYHKHNPERDFQRAYYDDVWKTVQQTRIIDRAIKIATSRMEEDDLQEAQTVVKQLQEAAEPIDVEAIFNCEEMIYAQMMKIPTSQHLLLIRMTPEVARATAQGIKNLFDRAVKSAGDPLQVNTRKQGQAELTTLTIGPRMPFQPTVAVFDDVLLLCSSQALAEQSLTMLMSGNGKSKFDDPRLVAALKKLPKPEDGLVFYDGKTQFEDFRHFGSFIRQKSGNDPKASRFAELFELVMDDVAIVDFTLSVQYTDGNLNRSASFTKMLPNIDDKTLAKMLSQGKPFAQWQSWIPAKALSYSLCTGMTLHPLYTRVMSILNENFPETHGVLDQFEQLQTQYDVHLDRDLLQAFSGEHVSVSLPSMSFSLLSGPNWVTALRCQKPDRIRQLLHRALDAIGEHPTIKAYGVELAPCEDLEGFETVSATPLAAMGLQPVIGFHDGWMFIGSTAQTVQQVLDCKAVKGKTIEDSEAFKQFKLDVQGPVRSIAYTNLAEKTRDIASAMSQVGMMAPMVLGVAASKADPEQLKPIQEILALLPDLGKIIGKFDFLEAQLSVTQDGPDPGTFVQRTVVVVRPVVEEHTDKNAEEKLAKKKGQETRQVKTNKKNE